MEEKRPLKYCQNSPNNAKNSLKPYRFDFAILEVIIDTNPQIAELQWTVQIKTI
jgi:hypothetical protein